HGASVGSAFSGGCARGVGTPTASSITTATSNPVKTSAKRSTDDTDRSTRNCEPRRIIMMTGECPTDILPIPGPTQDYWRSIPVIVHLMDPAPAPAASAHLPCSSASQP